MTKELAVTRKISASPQRVYESWTEPEQFAAWFGTEAVEIPLDSVTLDARPGGKLAAMMKLPDGSTINWAGEYVEAVPGKRLVFTLTDNPAEPYGEPLVADFVAVDGGTEVTLVQNVEEFDEEGIAALKEGYKGFFDDMEKVIARKP